MNGETTRSSSKLDPGPAWTIVTEAPLKGLALAREAGSILAWDEARQLYLIDLEGGYRSVAKAPASVEHAVISDDGSRVVLLVEGGRLCFLDADLGPLGERQGPPEPLALAIDPHGRYAVLSSKLGFAHFYNRHGKPAGKFATLQPLAHLAFVPDRPVLLGAAAYGMLTSLTIVESGGAGKLTADEEWVDRQITGVGRLATSGDGSMILASCFTHGVQRYDIQGDNEGSYHLGGTAVHAVPDFAGRLMAVATLEGELSVLSSAGNVRWRGGVSRAVVGLEVDALGRFLVYGHGTGEVVRLDLYASERAPGATDRERPAPARAPVRPNASASSRITPTAVRAPDWTHPVANSDEQAETAVVTVLDQPPRIGVFTSSLKLQLLEQGGKNLGHAPEILGVGRILRACPGWIAAATDRQIVVYHATRNAAQRVDLSLVEVTHLAIQPESFGLAIVQERDRVGRATLAGRWIWKKELKSAVEDLALGPDGLSALSTDDGRLLIFDPAGQMAVGFQTDPPEPLGLVEAVEEAGGRLCWMTLARRSQVLRGHDRLGKILWETPVAFEGWQFLRLGRVVAVVAADGRIQAFDGAGYLRGQGRGAGGNREVLTANAEGAVRRVVAHDVHLICSELDGTVCWRAICDEPIGPVAAGSTGVAAFIGRSLAWFSGVG